MKIVVKLPVFTFFVSALLGFLLLWGSEAGAAPAPEKNAEEYKIILKRPTINSLQDRIDKSDVKELLEFERFCRDNALWEEMKKCYTPDSRVEISWFRGTGHGFIEASKGLLGFAPHKIYNTEIWTHGDKAVAIMAATVQMRHNIDGNLVDLLSDAKLIFRTQRIEGQWYIVSFESIYEKESMVPVFPNALVNIPVEEISKYRSSYGTMIYMGKKNGLSISEDLAGIDRPDLVEKLYRATDKWLSE